MLVLIVYQQLINKIVTLYTICFLHFCKTHIIISIKTQPMHKLFIYSEIIMTYSLIKIQIIQF